MNSTITIPAATREEYRLVFALARLAAQDDVLAVQAINKVAAYQESLWQAAKAEAKAKAQVGQAEAN